MTYSPQSLKKKHSNLYDLSLKTKKSRLTQPLIYMSFTLINLSIGFLIVFLLSPSLVDKTLYFLLFIFITALNGWLAGLNSAIFTSAVSVLGSLYFFRFQDRFNYYLQAVVFILAGLFIAFIIDRAKKVDEFKKYKQREKEYTQSYIELYEKLNRAEQEIKSRDEFLSLASHELKTPLTSMLFQLQRMLNSIRHVSLANFSIPQLMKVLEHAEEQVKKLAKMINDLLNISLITTGRLDLDLEKVNLTKIAKNVINDFSDVLKREGYKVKLNAGLSVVGRWDKVRIEEVVTNLLSNAIKYGEGKPIEVNITNSKSTARLLVSDKGIGIPYEKQKILFEKFKRAVSPGDGKRGLGVGLYIVNQIVKAHTGTIKVVSKPGKGSTFVVELPLNKTDSG